jgi:hypothetical protein
MRTQKSRPKKVGEKMAKRRQKRQQERLQKRRQERREKSLSLNLSCCCLETGLKPVLFLSKNSNLKNRISKNDVLLKKLILKRISVG